MHFESLESAQEARVARGYRLEQLSRFFRRALQISRVHPQLDVHTLSMNQFFVTLGFFPPFPPEICPHSFQFGAILAEYYFLN